MPTGLAPPREPACASSAGARAAAPECPTRPPSEASLLRRWGRSSRCGASALTRGGGGESADGSGGSPTSELEERLDLTDQPARALLHGLGGAGALRRDGLELGRATRKELADPFDDAGR